MSEPDPPECLRKAEALYNAGNSDKALQILENYLGQDPSNSEVREGLAELLSALGRRDEAIKHYVRLQEQRTDSGDLLGAISAGLKVVKLDPQFDNPLSYVAKVNVDRLRDEADQQAKSDTTGQSKPQPTQAAKKPTEAASKAVAKIPLLSMLNPDELNSVALNMKSHDLDEGGIVFEQGDRAQSMYFVVKGMLEAAVDGKKLGLIRSAECIGEFAFLTGQVRSATVRALAKSELLELSPGSMQGVVRRHPRIREVLMAMYRERALTNVLAQSPLFEFMEASERVALAERFDDLELKAGTEVFRQGEVGGSLYLIKSGRLSVHANHAGSELELASLERGQFFGEVAFLTGVKRTASVVVAEDCELLRIGEKELRDLTAAHPLLVEILKQYHIDRMMHTAQMANSAGKVR